MKILRKSIDTMFDGSEKGIFMISKDEIYVSSLDPISNCCCSLSMKHKRIQTSKPFYPCHAKILFEPITKFLKIYNDSPININVKNHTITIEAITVHCDPNKTDQRFKNGILVLNHQNDDHNNYIYTEIPKLFPDKYVKIRMNPLEFQRQCLEILMSETKVTINQHFTLTCQFEMGFIEIKLLKQGKSVKFLKRCKQPFENSYIVKFFKHASTIASQASQLYIYMKKDSPILMNFHLKPYGIFNIVIAPILFKTNDDA